MGNIANDILFKNKVIIWVNDVSLPIHKRTDGFILVRWGAVVLRHDGTVTVMSVWYNIYQDKCTCPEIPKSYLKVACPRLPGRYISAYIGINELIVYPRRARKTI